MDTNNIFDIAALYKQYFNTAPYYITPKGSEKPLTQDVASSVIAQNPNKRGTIIYSSKNIPFNKIGSYGQDIWFPISFNFTYKSKNYFIEIDACTIAVNLNKTNVQTVVNDRIGTIQEKFNVDDYRFSIKGFLIGKNRSFPEDQIVTLKKMFITNDPVELHGGYPEMFLDKSCRVTILNVDFPEVQGKAVWIRPFTLNCISDFIQTLTIED